MTLDQWKSAHGWRLPVTALNELDTVITQSAAPCCGDYENCIDACIFRGKWLAQKQMADMPLIGCVQHDCAECKAREAKEQA